MHDDRRSLDLLAYGTMLACTMLWGLQQVAIKLALPAVAPLTQGAIRSSIATVLLLGWARWRGMRLLDRDGTLVPGIVAGLLFGAEFCFIYLGLAPESS